MCLWGLWRGDGGAQRDVSGVCSGHLKVGEIISSTLALPWGPGSRKNLINEEVERKRPTPTVWKRILQEDSIQPGVLELALTAQLCLVTGLGLSRPS